MCSTFNTTQHIFSPAQLFQNIILKNVFLLGTTAVVIRECRHSFLQKYSVLKKLYVYNNSMYRKIVVEVAQPKNTEPIIFSKKIQVKNMVL